MVLNDKVDNLVRAKQNFGVLHAMHDCNLIWNQSLQLVQKLLCLSEFNDYNAAQFFRERLPFLEPLARTKQQKWGTIFIVNVKHLHLKLSRLFESIDKKDTFLF